MERKEPDFSDNIFVKRNRWGGNEYLSLYIKYERDEDETKELYQPIHLTRYCVPGRCDTYNFTWWDRPQGWGDCLTYFSEGHTPLPQIMKIVQKDLDRPLVIEFLKEAANKLQPYAANHLGMFLRQLAPASKSVRAVERIAKNKMDENRQRVRAKLAEEARIAKIVKEHDTKIKVLQTNG